MNRFEFGSSEIDSDESLVCLASNVTLYDGDTKTALEDGEIALTSHRLIWTSPFDSSLCLSLSLKYVVSCEEEKRVFSFLRSPKIVLHLSPPSSDKGRGPVQTTPTNFIKLSYNNDLHYYLLPALRKALSAKRWTFISPEIPQPIQEPELTIKTRTGIVGIERGLHEKQKETEKTISIAFQDLSILMDKAKEMVNLSKVISTKIREKQGSITEDETVQFKSYLLSLGIDDPVTRESVSSESKYIEKLGKEVVDILESPIKEQGGMMSLSDAYCRVNRARGLELVSPEDLYRACRRLTTPLKLRVFDSGVMVLQLSEQDDSVTVEDTEAAIKVNGSLTAQELSQMLGISMLLAKERLLTTEKFGKICRDESIEGVRFYPNLFLENDMVT
ncbi:unnamed protein product [Nezara viridula]|uniref:Vacuolar protein-sorting-associated protein 36 n=1 Tax=Nezara viridula TaxID=85310 RepID=A0A9P0H305_NEZVI|nr:unnamed protein product [Nezara viridula]